VKLISTNKTAINPFDSQARIYAHQKEYETSKVARLKWPGKRKGMGQEKIRNEKSQKKLAYTHA